MKYRKLDPSGDYVLGRASSFYENSPQGVAQAVATRLRLATGEWFLDTNAGTPYEELILGYNTQGSRDTAIKARILGTPGVVELLKYSSDVTNRKFSVTAQVLTEYSTDVLPTINVTF